MKLKAKETAVLFVPFFALASAAWWLGRKPPKPTNSGPFRLMVQSVQREKPTPRDVAEGFDSRVMVMVGHRGQRPQKWSEGVGSYGSNTTLLDAKTGQAMKNTSFQSALRSPTLETANDLYVVPLVYQSRSAPANLKTLDLEISLQTSQWEKSPKQNWMPYYALRFQVPHQIVNSLPVVSKYCPLRLHSVRPIYSTVVGAGGSYKMEAFFSSVEPIVPYEQNPIRPHNVRPSFFENERGQRFSSPASYGGQALPEQQLYSFNWDVYLSGLPKQARRARKLTFKTRVSLGESWPIPVSVVLWNKTKSATAKASNKPVTHR